MGPMPKALIAVGSLLAAGTWAAPAEAAPAAGTVVVKNCSTTKDGVPLRVKMRFQMRSTSDPNDVRWVRVRVSHPDGTGNFHETRVQSVATGLFFESQSTNPQLGSAVWAVRHGDDPAFRKWVGSATASLSALVTFRLVDGHRAVLNCTQHFPQD
jgi:hypothetical protein